MAISWQKFLFLLFTLALSACSTLPKPQQISTTTPSINWSQRQAKLAAIKYFQIDGAVAIKTPQKAFSANLHWQQMSAQNYIVNLFGPLGMGAVTIKGQPGLVTLQDSQQIYQAASPEQLLENNMDWELPITNLYYWVRGLPAPGLQAKIQLDKANHLILLQQQGWTITYLAYTQVSYLELPSKILLSNHYLSVRVVIGMWQLR